MRRPRPGEDGFAMVFVIMVISMVTVAVAAVLTVVTPDIARTKLDQDGQGASAAARAAVDDFVAYLSGIDKCRSTTRVCAAARGASGAPKTLDAATGTTISWTSDAALTAEGYVRVHGTGTYGRATRTLDADLALAPSILSYGYYSDYESQSSDSLNQIYRAHTVRLDKSDAWTAANLADLTKASTATWSTPSSTTTCDRHWWNDTSTGTSVAGRNDGGTWKTGWSFDTVRTTGTTNGGCDIIFASGMTLDGPVYTRDALLINGAGGGGGPIFKQTVLTGWGGKAHKTPAVPATTTTTGPWRQDTSNTGTLSSSPNKPQVASFDLTLPEGIGTDGLADNACVYTGPTRITLNGDGTATVTSPDTTSKASTADPACYPAAVTGGITRFTVNYGTVGGGTVLVRNIGTEPAAGWAATGQTATTTPGASTSTFWNTATGTGTPSNGSSAAPDTGCSSSVTYSAAVNATCAWSETPAYSSTSGGWTAYTSSGSCATNYAATDQRRFECEYSKVTSGTPSKTFPSFRTAVKNALSSSTCATATSTPTARQQCLVDLLSAQLPAATTSVRYVVLTSGGATPGGTNATGTAVAGTTRALTGAAPPYPQAADPIFAKGPTSTGTESSTYTPVTLAVSRQTSTDGKTWTGTTAQFTLTVTTTTWTVASAPTAVSYFPSTADVTQYAGSTGSAVPGDLYVEGTNKGKLSLLADNDVVVTSDLKDAGSDITVDAVNLVAGQYVRNYHPVSCVDTTAASIAATSPGWCPNDVTNLYSTAKANAPGSSGTAFDSTHPAVQYTNLQAAGTRTVEAAIFALDGSLTSDNYNRGTYMGALQVNGGVYQGHRGVNGTQSANNTGVARTGYLLQYHYVDLRASNLPYEPSTRVKSGRVWSVVSVEGSGPS